MDACRGVGANPYIEIARFGYHLLSVEEFKIFRSQDKRYFSGFAGLQGYPLEPFQLFYRSGNRSKAVANIQLYHFVGIAVATVGYRCFYR